MSWDFWHSWIISISNSAWYWKESPHCTFRSYPPQCISVTNSRVISRYVVLAEKYAHVELHTVYHKKYAHGFVVLCFVVVMQSFIMNSHEVFIHIHQGCFAGTGAIVRLSLCQWSKPDGYGKISQCITTTKHSKAKTVCIFLGIYCITCIPFSVLMLYTFLNNAFSELILYILDHFNTIQIFICNCKVTCPQYRISQLSICNDSTD